MLKTILIIEDEKPNANRLVRMLRNLRPKAVIVSIETSVAAAVNWLSANPAPTVIMMDIRLGDGVSFDIFNQVEVNCPVIFTTAYDEYAVRAFKYNSVDYLLKPIEEDELAVALDKFEKANVSRPVDTLSIEGLANFLQLKNHRTRFFLPYRDGYKTLSVKDIQYFFADVGVVKAVLKNGTSEIVPQTLEELENQLSNREFFRVNRKFIIHTDSISHVTNSFNGKLKVELKMNPDVEIIISRDRAGDFKSWMDY